jgi:hypothetical protein
VQLAISKFWHLWHQILSKIDNLQIFCLPPNPLRVQGCAHIILGHLDHLNP